MINFQHVNNAIMSMLPEGHCSGIKKYPRRTAEFVVGSSGRTRKI